MSTLALREAARRCSRTFYARGQTGQQLLLGCYQALEKEIANGGVTMYPRTEMLDLIVVDGQRAGIVVRDMVTGAIEAHLADAVILGDRRLRQRLLPVDEREGVERDGDLARLQARRRVRESVLHADPSDVHSRERRLSVEAHADVRVASQRRPVWVPKRQERQAAAERNSRDGTRLLSRAEVSELRQPLAARHRVARGEGSVRRRPRRRPGRPRRLSRFRRRHPATRAKTKIAERYGNLFEMYERITDEIRTRFRCASIPPCTTRWAACGSTTT